VRLAYYYGMTREEIAARIDRPVSTVKTWLRRSLAQLKDCLSSDEPIKLELIAEAAEAYEPNRWRQGQIPGGKS
jgi:transposase